MLKYLLFHGIKAILTVFNDSYAEDPSRIQNLLDEANSEAALVWLDKETPFLVRQERCRSILSPVLKLNKPEGETFTRASKSVTDELSRIFNRVYTTSDELLLIGRTDEEAYKVQDEYAVQVGALLEPMGPHYKSRAITTLQRVYGQGSLPLLCISSVSGIWQLCWSAFYKKQISLVSLLCLAYQPLC